MLTIQTGEKNPVLRKACKKVEVFDTKLESLIAEMIETMVTPDDGNKAKGVGLASNQVGTSARVILITLNAGAKKGGRILPMINPEILELSQNEVVMEEGCLSLPGKFANISRPAKVKVRWQNVAGNWCERKFNKFDARIFLHEFDHLEGILFTDYLRTSEQDGQGIVESSQRML